jgi:hypothetical protein
LGNKDQIAHKTGLEISRFLVFVEAGGILQRFEFDFCITADI